MTTLTIKNSRVGPILGRHPWVFSGALKFPPNDNIESGTPVRLVDEDKKFLAQGYFNSYSQISVRIWSYDENEEVNDDFFLRRIEKAYAIRAQYVASKKTDSYRLVHSENDLLPGLIVDKYADYLVIQCHTAGINFWKQTIVDALIKVLKPKGIYERSEVASRKVEKDEGTSGLLYGKVPEKIKITENGFKFYVDVIHGQKTGFFLDQREKRQALAKYVEGKKVLNCFSYTGGFSVYALAANASKVTSVDVSKDALSLAKANVALNKLDESKCEFVAEDVKEFLRKQEKGAYDVIILDPPAFIKDRRKINEGLVGYKKINEQALAILPPGGILVSCSCSAHLSMPSFRYMLSESAGRSRRTLKILETFTHAPDHPELVAFTEGEYLKVIFGIVE